jgi:hypothetical protein
MLNLGAMWGWVVNVYFNYSELCRMQVLGCCDHGVLGKTTLRKLRLRKKGLRERGILRTTPPPPALRSLKIRFCTLKLYVGLG